MIEPTESESKYELDRFVDAMIAIRVEIDAIPEGGVADSVSAQRPTPGGGCRGRIVGTCLHP